MSSKSSLSKSGTPIGSRSQSVRNDVFAGILVLFIFVATIPLGSNRPGFWAGSGLVVATISVFYYSLLWHAKSAVRREIGSIKLLLALYMIFLSYIVMQFIPLGEEIDAIFNPTIGGRIENQTISITPGMSFLYLIQFSVYGLLFFLTLQVAHNSFRARMMLISLFGVVVIFAVYALLALFQLGDTILFFEKWTYFGVATGTFVNRNSFATFLSFGMIIGAVFCVSSLLPNDKTVGQYQNILAGLLYLVGTSVIIATLLSTQSRMGFFSGTMGAGVASLLILLKSPKARPYTWPILIFVFAGGVILFILYGGGLLERVGSVESARDGRFELYSQVQNMILNRPWTGYGAGSFELAFPLFHQLPISPDVVWDKAHSTYLTLWSEMGIVTGSIPIVLIAIIAGKSWQLYRITKTRWPHAAITFGVIITAALHSLVDFSLEIHAVALLFSMILAIGMAGPAKSRATRDDV